MKLISLIVIGVVVVLALLAGIVTLIGASLPVKHVASRSLFLHQTPQQVYAVARDFGSAPSWRSDLKTRRR